MRRVISLFLCLCLTLCLFGCGGNDSTQPTGGGLDTELETEPTQSLQEEVLPAVLVYDPDDSMNPLLSTGYVNRVLFSLIYQGLFTVNADYQVSPMLCRSYNVSADWKTYTFYLSDALFSDGDAVTAEDVVASLTAAMDSAWYSGRLQHVKSVSSYGEAVVVELNSAMQNFPILLDIPVLKAEEVGSERPLGSGPYRLAGDQMKRQAAWWCDAQIPVSSDSIDLLAYESPAQIRDAFEFQGVSLVCADPTGTNRVDYHSDYELWECESGLFLYLACNEDSKIFSDDALRRALTYAIDRELLADEFYWGFAMAASVPASPASPWYNTYLAAKYAYAPESFQSAVETAGCTGAQITLLVNAGDQTRVKVGKAIAQMLEKGGLTVTVEEATADTFVTLLEKGDYDLYLAQTRLPRNMDISAFFGQDTALNYGGLSDPSAYAISLETLSDPANFYTLHEMVMENGWLCPILFQSYALYVQRGSLDDFAPARDAVFYYDLGRTMEEALGGEA